MNIMATHTFKRLFNMLSSLRNLTGQRLFHRGVRRCLSDRKTEEIKTAVTYDSSIFNASGF